MEKERINVAEILRNCQAGMILDCVCFENVVFDRVDDKNRIRCFVGSQRDEVSFNEYGCLNGSPSAKCVIFPKDTITWVGFIPPRKYEDGDVVFTALGNIAIISNKVSEGIVNTYCVAFEHGTFTIGDMCVRPIRLATEEEKQELFTVIKNKGYKWNSETKTLEKLIVPKFDINTLVPFGSRVLVRHNNDNKWCGSFFSHIDKDFHSHCFKFVTTAGKSYPKMIPYEGNEHLLGTTDDCDDFYKTWPE